MCILYRLPQQPQIPVDLCSNYRQVCAQLSHAGIVFTQWSKNGFFAPQGRHIAPRNGKFGKGSKPAVPSPCQISRISGQKCRDTAPKVVKIWNFGHKFAPPGQLVCTIYGILSGLYASIQGETNLMLACDDIMSTGWTWTPAAASSTLEEWTRTFSRGRQCSCFRITVFYTEFGRDSRKFASGV